MDVLDAKRLSNGLNILVPQTTAMSLRCLRDAQGQKISLEGLPRPVFSRCSPMSRVSLYLFWPSSKIGHKDSLQHKEAAQNPLNSSQRLFFRVQWNRFCKSSAQVSRLSSRNCLRGSATPSSYFCIPHFRTSKESSQSTQKSLQVLVVLVPKLR